MIEVVGLTARGWPDLADPERSLVRDASLLVGGRRLLDLVPRSAGQRTAELPRPLRDGLPPLLDQEDRPVVLASGDPFVSGIGSTLVDAFGADRVRVHPAVSSVALAGARMGWPAETVTTVSLVARPVDRIRRHLADGARLIVLSADRHTPPAVAALLVDAGFGGSALTVLGDLGSEAESRTDGTAERWPAGESSPQLNVVCADLRADAGSSTYGWTAGLPDEAYDHDGQLTKRDVRAAVLARLAPQPGELLWDLGAGAGSVAIEWCRADVRCRAVAVERDRLRADRIRANAARLGVPDLGVVAADTSDDEVLAGLAAPDAIFLGGGASERLIERGRAALRPGGRLVVSAVTVETEQLVIAAARRYGGELVRISVESLQPIGGLHGWTPARAVVLWAMIKERG